MNRHYARCLQKRYDPLYSGRYGGFAVRDGWFNIINTLSYELCRHWLGAKRTYEEALKTGQDYWGRPVDINLLKLKMEDEYSKVPRVQQVKEKFGGLRFYVADATPEQYAAIEFAEQLSVRTCEECGQIGRQRSTGWIQTLCGKHLREYNQRRRAEYGDEDDDFE